MECQCAGCHPERMARKKFRDTMSAIDKVRDERDVKRKEPQSEDRTKTLEGLDKLLNILTKRLTE